MLKKLRENMKMILWITIISFVLLIFLAWGMDIQSGRGPTGGTIAKVSGYAITSSELQQAERNTFDIFRQQLGRQPTDAEHDALKEQAWTNLVQRIILTQEAEKRGLIATDEEVVYAIRMDPPQFVRSMEMFQTNGVFDPQKYRQSLSDPLMDWSALESWVRATLPISKLQDLVTLGVRVSEQELKETYNMMYETRTISYVVIDPSGFTPAEGEIAEDRLRQFYSENEERFTEPEQAKLSYVFLELAPSAADSNEVMGDLMRVLQEIRGGEDFAEMARIHSEDPSAEQGGDPGNYFKKGDLNADMERVVFSMDVGQISEPFLDANGYHLVKLEEKTAVDGEEQVKFRNILKTVTPGQTTVNLLWEKTQRIEKATVEGLPLADAAKAEALQVTETPYFRRDGFVPGLAGLPAAKEMGFEMQRGAVRGPFTTYKGHYFIQLVDRKEERLRPFAEVREDCRNLILDEARAELAYRKAQELALAASGADSLERVAEAESLEVVAGGPFNRSGYAGAAGRDLTLIGTAFAASPGDPVFAVKGQRASYVVRVDAAEKADPGAFERDKTAMSQRLLQQKRGRAYTAWISNLEAEADIKDYRERY